MYEAFYGFKEKPFSMLPDPSFLFLSKKHRAALTLLEYGLMNQVGFCILSGEPGAGKTTILRALLKRVDDNVRVGLISNTHQSFGGLLDWILSAFDLHKANLTQVEMHQLFVDFLIEEYGKNRRVLLIVDEAQNMDPASLEELRMLSNVNTEKDQLLQVVLAGQPQLKENLRKPELSQFAQRIAVDYHLHSLNLNETCGYIQHRLVVAGAERDVFTPDACERIHCYSGGSPRLINLLCETALVYGFADEKELIDADLVEEMVHERMEDSVVPLANLNGENEGASKNTDQLVKDFPWIRPEGGTKGLKPEVKAKLAEIEQSKKTAKPESEVSDVTLPPITAPQSSKPLSPEPESPLPNDLVSRAETLGGAVVNDAAGQAKDKVANKDKAPQNDTPAEAGEKKEPVVSAPVKNGSTQVRDAYEKEIFAKNKIKAAKSKNNIFKYLFYISIVALGLVIASLFFSDYTRDFSVFEKGEQVFEPDVKKPQLSDHMEGGLDDDAKVEGAVERVTKENADKAVFEKIELERLEQEKLERGKLEKERLEKEKLEQEVLEKEKLEKTRLEQERLEQEKLEQEKSAKEQLEEEQAAQLKEFRAQERREARKREAEAKRRIARQIKQREAELEAQEEARRRQLEAKEKREAEEKIKQEQETIRLQNEWLKKEREKLREIEATETPTVKKTESFSDDGFVSQPPKKIFSNCDGPAAKFKSECR